MDKRFAIFDMDGTLVDSMGAWKRLGEDYLRSRGITRGIREVLEQVKPLTMEQSAQLFCAAFGLPDSPEEVAGEMNAIMEEQYRARIPLKPGAAAYLERLRRRGVEMCVASATARPLMKACLERLGVRADFVFLLSCEEVGTGKHQPDVYYAAARRLGAAPEEIAVYEDACYAVETAKAAGFYVVGVYDSSAGDSWERIRTLADETIEDWASAR